MDEQTNAAPKKLSMKDLQEQIEVLIVKYNHLFAQHTELSEAHQALAKKFNDYKNTHPLKKVLTHIRQTKM